MKITDAALQAHDAGLSVLPVLGDGSKRPPFVWAAYQQSRATREQVRQWFVGGQYTGYAAICGAVSGQLEILDFDDATIYQTFLDTAEAIGLGEFLDWMRWGYEERTPDGGAHLLYRCTVIGGNEGLAKRPTLPEERKHERDLTRVLIETRGEGGYAIIAPSNGTVHPTGGAWSLVSGGIDTIPSITPEDRESLFRLARSFDQMPPEEPQTTRPSEPRANVGGNRPGDDYRSKHGSLDSFRAIVESHGWKLVHHRAGVGYFRRPGKNDGISATFGHAGTDLFYVFTTSTEFESNRGYNPFSVYAKLNHAGSWIEAARELGYQGYGEQPIILTTNGHPPTGTPHVDKDGAEVPRPSYALTDMGNAERLAWSHGSDLRYCHLWNKWLIWDGARFALDDCGVIATRAKSTVRSIYGEAATEADDKRREAIVKHAKSSESSSRITAMAGLTQSEPGVPVRPSALDLDPWLLNCANGTVDLRTGQLTPHDRADLMTKMAATSFDSTATCPRFLAYLDQIMGGDADLVRFLQRALGYSLTGVTSERAIFILYGEGKNGKSTLVEVMDAVLGDYAMRTPTESLLAKRDQGIPNDIARLQNLRFVYASEAEEGQRLAEAKIKDMTGGDTLTARFLHGEFFDFKPAFKLWFSTNHKPVIRGTDRAIWDRIRLVPFLVRIPPEDQDKHLREKLIEEAGGILAWCVTGCLDWQRDGLQEPAGVINATRDYQSEMNVIERFITDCCVIDPNATVTSKDMYSAYVEWYKKGGEEHLTQTALGKRMAELGFDTAQLGKNRARSWVGIGLISEKEESSDGW